MALSARLKALRFTAHSRFKMKQYGLSEQRVKRVLHAPSRVEHGIAEGTVAMMQRTGTRNRPTELWVMTADSTRERRVVSAWRYPGVTKPGEPLPPEILREIEEAM
jgi:hypothetical protein